MKTFSDKDLEYLDSPFSQALIAGEIGKALAEDFLRTVLRRYTSEDEVMQRNTEDSAYYATFLDSTGYASIYDAYVQLCMPHETISKGGNKDMSKLVATKRTVVRNGKQMQVTVYEDPNADNKDNKDPSTKESGGSAESNDTPAPASTTTNAVKMDSSITNPTDTKAVGALKKDAMTMAKRSGRNYGFKDTMTYYLSVKDAGKVVGVVGYKKDGHYLKMEFVQSNGKVSNVGLKGIIELFKLGAKDKLGIKVAKGLNASFIAKTLNMQQDDRGDWYMGYTDLSSELGGN